MTETYRVDHHTEFSGGADNVTQDGWSSRKKLCCFLGMATLAWSLILVPFLFLG